MLAAMRRGPSPPFLGIAFGTNYSPDSAHKTVAPSEMGPPRRSVAMAARGIAGWRVCLGYKWVMTDKITLRFAAASTSPFP